MLFLKTIKNKTKKQKQTTHTKYLLRDKGR